MAGPEAPPVCTQAPAEEAPAAAADPDETEPPLKVPRRSDEAPIASYKSLPKEYDLLLRAKPDKATGRWVVDRDGKPAALTIDPALQEQLTKILRDYQTPYAAAVALEPSTGRVLAMVEHSQADPSLRGLPVAPIFPAASVFKVVTASALLTEGISPGETECFHGGKRRLSPKLLEDSARDSRCVTLSEALGMSANVAFAKFTARVLTADKLRAMAKAYHFNRPLDFPVPTAVSLAGIPDDPLGLPTAGAGFGDVYLSPLHGALMAAVPANKGLWREPVLFEQDAPAAPPQERVLAEADARALADMMEQTVTIGTARRIFRERAFRVPGAVGKTGCLADRNPYRDYSWFIGYAPKDDPKVAVAAVIVNDYAWRIRATYLGREALRLALEGEARWAKPLIATVPPPDATATAPAPAAPEQGTGGSPSGSP
ncbi:MAG TPA: penicillin-binding transpeptidase domain-containing protein [Myxococcales bacterium]|nr:penicillin-binding transpeptidase domain-containing protein [Myxococcales bacterium]